MKIPPPSPPAVAALQVYEIVDATSDENYFTQGMWLTLDAAIAAIEKLDDPKDMDSCQYDDIEFARAEIRERDLGWSATGRVVYVREWSLIEHEDADSEWNVTRSERVGKGLEAHNG